MDVHPLRHRVYTILLNQHKMFFVYKHLTSQNLHVRDEI